MPEWGSAHVTGSKPREEIFDQAATLKASLRDVLRNTHELIRSLKRQRKQSRMVQNTLASLKQLQKSA